MSSSHNNLSVFNPADLPVASDFVIAVITAEWNSQITDELLKGTIDTLISCKVKKENIHLMKVPGSFELSAGAAMAAATKKYNAIICLGCIIQGETRHFEFIAQAVAYGLTGTSVKFEIPVIFGVLTTDTIQQAIDRSGGRHGNKGVEAAITAIKMIDLKNKLK